MAEVLLDAASQVTGQATEFTGYPKGFRAMQLPDANVDSFFLKTFGRPDRERTCECERTSESSVGQILHLANGGTFNKKISSTENKVSKCLAKQQPAGEIVEEAYFSAFSRPPSEQEKSKLARAIDDAGPEGRRTAIEDLYWALLSSKEFLFNH